MKWIFISFVLVAGTFAAVIREKKRHEALAIYWARTCTGRLWKRRFPAASKREIRVFLDLFVDAFMFRPKHRLSFSPDDQVMDIYRALYPPDWSLADALECETFVLKLKKIYGLDLVPLWRADMTLGDVFALAQLKTKPCA